ncbi:MAG: IS5 family transposase [Thermoanaerobaculia bacterium]|nr:IS5 family transposase [Thermoanaerobaculia bacterium]
MQPQFERLTDDQWKVIKLFLNHQRKRKHDLREIINAILWITRTGCQWRNLDKSYPPWESVYYYFGKWGKDGTWELICQSLNMVERIQLDREPTPSLGLVDSQSVKLSPMIFESRGVDGNKKINGRKRQVLVDVLGRLWKVKVHAAHQHDSPEGVGLLDDMPEHFPRLKKIMADKSYRGTFAQAVEKIGLVFEVPQRADGAIGFVVEAKRWVVERTFAWLNFFRRVVVDYERTPQSAQSFLLLANISMVIWRINWSGL